MLFVLIFIAAALPARFAWALPEPNSLLEDSIASAGSGDYFHAYRSFRALEETKSPLLRAVVDTYVNTLFILLPEESVRKECDRLGVSNDEVVANKANYVCGLSFLQQKNPAFAEKYIRNVDKSSKLHWPAQILMATIDLFENRAGAVFQHLKLKDLKDFAKYDLEDEFYLARGRAAIAQNRYEDAAREYQSIPSSSTSYLTAIYETAWLFFKMGRYESAQVLLDAIRANYEGTHGTQGLNVSPTVYYKSRYLEAYLNLEEQRAQGATTLFSDFKTDYDHFLNKVKYVLDASKNLQMIHDENGRWTDVRGFTETVKTQLAYLSSWVSPEESIRVGNKILFLGALTREVARTEKFKSDFRGELAVYPAEISRLQERAWNDFSRDYLATIKGLSRGLNTLALKAELGRLEIIWLGRSQGARNLDEIIDDYRHEVHAVDEFASP